MAFLSDDGVAMFGFQMFDLDTLLDALRLQGVELPARLFFGVLIAIVLLTASYAAVQSPFVGVEFMVEYMLKSITTDSSFLSVRIISTERPVDLLLRLAIAVASILPKVFKSMGQHRTKYFTNPRSGAGAGADIRAEALVEALADAEVLAEVLAEAEAEASAGAVKLEVNGGEEHDGEEHDGEEHDGDDDHDDDDDDDDDDSDEDGANWQYVLCCVLKFVESIYTYVFWELHFCFFLFHINNYFGSYLSHNEVTGKTTRKKVCVPLANALTQFKCVKSVIGFQVIQYNNTIQYYTNTFSNRLTRFALWPRLRFSYRSWRVVTWLRTSWSASSPCILPQYSPLCYSLPQPT